MKKFLSTLLLLLFSFAMFSQTTYEISVTNLRYGFHFSSRPFKNDTKNSNVAVRLKYSNSSSVDVLFFHGNGYFDGRGVPYNYGTFSKTIRVHNKLPNQIETNVFANRRQSKHDADKTQQFSILNQCQSDRSYTFRANSFDLTFNAEIKPIIELSRPNNDLIGFDDNFNVSVESNSTGFPTSFYNWQYQAISSGLPTTNGWINMPSNTNANGSPSFSITPSSFLHVSDIGKRVYFRIKTCNGLFSEGPPIFYNLKASAPHINIQDKTNSQCNSGDDGSARVYLDRALQDGEIFGFSISLDGSPVIIKTKTDNLTKDDFDANNSFLLQDLVPGNYSIRIFNPNFYTGSLTHTDTFTINEPTPVEFTEKPKFVNVWCNGGSDGEITLKAKGGKGSYRFKKNTDPWKPFTSGSTHTIKGLSPSNYSIQIQDTNGCVAKVIKRDGGGQIIGLGAEITEKITITEPDAPVAIDFVFSKEPTAFGFSNGRIRAQITGGTVLSDDTYNYTWTHENGTSWTTFTDEVTTDGWFLTLENAIVGTYKLTVTDANYDKATNKTGCTIIEEVFTLEEPPLLKLSSTETSPVSCHNTNIFNDPWSDGELTAIASGGVPLKPTDNNGLKYYYTWKKETSPGIWKELVTQTTNVATGLDLGNYAVNILDANGITVGTATNNIVNPIDVLYTLTQPKLLEVSSTKTALLCSGANDATATVSITGGTAPYTIQWSNGQNLATATNLTAGNHIVYVTDARGCKATSNISIDQPGGLQINVVTQTNPTCFEGSDGKIELGIIGGSPPYTYSWDTGATSTSINNLPQGKYTFALTDFNECRAFKEIVLEHPDEIIIDLGADRTLCKEQTHDLDGSIAGDNASYVWTSENGFSATTPEIRVSEAGTYQVTATSSLGCVAIDTIVISYNDTEIDSGFLLSSQAYQNQDVILFNVSKPIGETSQWVLPPEVTIVSETETSITLRFPEINTYKIGLISTQGDCNKKIYKNIVLEESSGLADPGDSETPFIEEFTMTPNPNNGQFELYIDLAKSSPIAIRVFNIQGSVVLNKTDEPTAKEYTIPIDLALPSGTYVVILETAKQTQVKRMIVD